MKIGKVPLSRLRPWEKNPRIIKDKRFEELKASMQDDPEFMEFRPLLALKDGRVFCGNMRLRAAQALGWKDIPCAIMDIPEKLARKRAIRDNNEYGEWQEDELAELLYELREEGEDIDNLGFEEDFLARLMDDATLEDLEEDGDIAIPKEAKSKLGDLYRMGEHFLLCGDATQLSDVKRIVGGGIIDLVLTDPPYNVDYTGKTKEKLKLYGDRQSDEEYAKFILTSLKNMNTVTKEGGAIYLCHADSNGLLMRRAFEEAGWMLKQCIIFKKDSIVMGRQDYHWQHEPILYGWKEGTHYFINDRTQSTVWEIDRPKRSEEHPTMKPLELCAVAIRNSSRKGETVFDAFGGSGSTLIACEELGRKCRMLEIDPRYIDVCIARWQKLTGGTAELIQDGKTALKTATRRRVKS